MVTGLDLVKLQIQIAAGEPLPFEQRDIALRGHAIECRIYAEDPDNNFFPSPGTISGLRTPSGPGIRLDDGVYAGWTVPNEYDPMLGKLAAWGGDRAQAIARLARALGEYYATGIKTNIRLFRRILADKDFQDGEIHTHWLDEFLARPRPDVAANQTAEFAALLAAALWHQSRAAATNSAGSTPKATRSPWKLEGRREQLQREPGR
jgi:acetyl-CoA carboxylase biotin carboxylase subunit